MKNIKRVRFLLVVFIISITVLGFSSEDRVIEELRAVNKKMTVYIALGDVDEVNVMIDVLLGEYPENQTVKLFAAEKYSDLGEHEMAVEMLDDINLKLLPEGFYSPLLIGKIYHSAEKYEQARQYLEKASEYEDVFPIVYNLLEECHAKL